MRIVKVGVLAPTNKGIPLGVQGENCATEVEFDTRPWFREYPHGTVSAVARRNGDPAPYPLTLDVEDGTAVWQVSDTDTAKAGEGAVELTMTSAGARVRSLTFKTLVTASLTDAPVDDDAWYGWLDKAVVKVDETVQAAQRKMAEVDEEWTGLKDDVTSKVDECGKVAAQAAEDAHHAKVDAQAVAKALESAESSVAKAEDAAKRAVNAALAADDSAVEASRSALSALESEEAAGGSATNAATSASEAATSAINAADSASAASGSASAAAQSATDASNAKVAAQTAKAEADAAKSEAATSASNAAKSATAAAKSASDAAANVNAINVIAPKTVNVSASSSDQFDIAIGQNANTTANQSIAIGVTSTASHLASIALGSFSETSKDYELSLGVLLENGFDSTREITHVSAPTEPNSASNKKYTDDNDAKTLTEAKKYTDDNTSNALVGNVSGKLLHVEDAWPSKPVSLTIDGAYKQDGTPSHENPVPITVIENPVLWLTGRNLLDPSKMANTWDGYVDVDGELQVKSVDGRNWVNVQEYGVLPAGSYYIGGDTIEVRRAVDNISLAYSTDGRKQTFKLDTATHVKIKVGIGHPDSQYPYVTHVMLLASSGNEVAYAPYAGTSLPITLPAEHPYLAALPNGTHDEIVVRDGRVSINCVLRREVISDIMYVDNSTSFQYVNVNVATGKPIDGDTNFICDRFIPGGRYAGGVYVAGGVNAMFFFCFQLGTFQDSSEAAAWFAANPTTVVYTDGNGAKTIDLGKLDIPALPETISNVWTGAELTPECSMTYKRDINVAFDNLVQAVVAAAAGE